MQPFLGFVESGFPFTHNGGAAPTRQAADGLVVADGLLLAIESTLTARVDGLLGE